MTGLSVYLLQASEIESGGGAGGEGAGDQAAVLLSVEAPLTVCAVFIRMKYGAIESQQVTADAPLLRIWVAASIFALHSFALDKSMS